MNARIAFLGAVVAIGALAACGGGGGGGGVTPSGPSSDMQNADFLTTATSTVSFPKISNGISATVTLPIANVATSGSLVESVSPPEANMPDITSSKKIQAIGGNVTAVVDYFALTVPSAVVVSSTMAFSVTAPASVSGNAYVLYYDANNPGNGYSVLLGPGTAAGGMLTFPAQSLPAPVTFQPKDTYIFAVVIASSSFSASTGASYTGTKTVNYTYGYDFGFPAPSPSATAPPTTLSYNVTTTISAGSSPFPSTAPAGVSLVDAHVAESDTSSLATTSFTTDEWTGLAATSGSEDVSIYGTLEQEPSSADLPVFTTIYGTPQLVDQYPETAGTSWTNSPASTETYSFADGDNGVRTTTAAGYYTDTENILAAEGGQQAIITENADGSGSITGPYYGGGIIDSEVFSAPTGGNVTLTIAYSAFAQANYGFPATESLSEAAFYPLPVTFYTETDKVTSGAAFPSGCGTTYGSSGTKVERSITTYDTVIGFEETTVMDSYDNGGVPVCLNTVDTLNYAYDEQNNTPYLIDFYELGLEVVTTTETLNLQPGGTSALPGTAGTAAATRAASATVAALEAHELTSFAHARIDLEHAYLKSIRTRNAASVKIQGGHR